MNGRQKPHECTNMGKVKNSNNCGNCTTRHCLSRKYEISGGWIFVLRSVQRSSPQWFTHTTSSITSSVSWHTDAHKYDWDHMDARQVYPQALLSKQSFMCGKWIEGFPISWVWWCFRINCTVLCLVYYYSVGPYIPFIFLIGYFPDILKIPKIQFIFKKMQSVMQCVACCAQNIWNL